MNFDVDVFVIIKPGSFHVLVVQRETKRLNEMELAAGISAKPNYVASVGGNFWVRQFGVGRTAEVEFPARQSLASSRYLALEQKP